MTGACSCEKFPPRKGGSAESAGVVSRGRNAKGKWRRQCSRISLPLLLRAKMEDRHALTLFLSASQRFFELQAQGVVIDLIQPSKNLTRGSQQD